jgi:hypothetical protein
MDARSARAWTERMAVEPRGDGEYAVDTDSGTYVVELGGGRCSCPDHGVRRERCKHLRRVAIEITLERVPPPGRFDAACVSCGAGADGADRRLPLCPDCELDPGERVLDRETGAPLRVVAVTDYRADEVEVPERGYPVADHPTNDRYDSSDVVIDAAYADDGRPGRQVYSFPRSRLDRRRDDGQSTLPDHDTADSTPLES